MERQAPDTLIGIPVQEGVMPEEIAWEDIPAVGHMVLMEVDRMEGRILAAGPTMMA